MSVIKVGMADLNIAITPDRLRTTGLGSCVGIAIVDKVNHIGGLAHIMLPSSEMVKIGQLNKAKYADTAVPLLVEKMVQLGAKKSLMVAKLAGGAQMFQFQSQNDMMRIGPRNVEASKVSLKELGIPIIAEDTGGNFGRTIELDILTGILYIKTANQGVNEI
ncbi:chemotaxis protein CheD [Tepidibacillus infernus]|uniref:Probable chemoreceptor glutamine deamidase CheD n=1 Tax=Tepidibacillus decaturensis TaxID=1413211 RepID=A0A135L3G2_9BACI|nr:chemotaxis protein CheD [Tepidibacillus decaturensis]KXG43409.1 chemotaxis protein CheD [Tepidibacillus decaturensis]